MGQERGRDGEGERERWVKDSGRRGRREGEGEGKREKGKERGRKGREKAEGGRSLLRERETNTKQI